MTEPRRCAVCGAVLVQGKIGPVAFAKRKTCSVACAGVIKRRPRAKREPVCGTPKDADAEVTFAEIGEALGVSGERVRQIYNSAMRKLRHGLGA